jgi:MFS family permease
MAVWVMGAILGPIIGTALGGWLTENYNWRWVFYSNVPFGILAFLGILSFLPEESGAMHGFAFNIFRHPYRCIFRRGRCYRRKGRVAKELDQPCLAFGKRVPAYPRRCEIMKVRGRMCHAHRWSSTSVPFARSSATI